MHSSSGILGLSLNNEVDNPKQMQTIVPTTHVVKGLKVAILIPRYKEKHSVSGVSGSNEMPKTKIQQRCVVYLLYISADWGTVAGCYEYEQTD